MKILLKGVSWLVLAALAIVAWILKLVVRMLEAGVLFCFETIDPKRHKNVRSAATGESPLPPPRLRLVPELKQPKHLKKWGCAVESGWQVETVMQKEGMRVEFNEATGTRRLVHSGTGQIIDPNLQQEAS